MSNDTDSESSSGSGPGRDLRGYLGELALAFVLINLLVGLVGWLVGRYMGEPRLGVLVFAGGSLVVTFILGVIVLVNAGIIALVKSIRRWTAPETMEEDDDAAAAPPSSSTRPGTGDDDRGEGGGNPDPGGGAVNAAADGTRTPESAPVPEPASVVEPVS